jgi:DNA processing protein
VESLLYKIGITLVPGIGPATAKKLITYTGGVEAIFKDRKKALIKIPGIRMSTAEAITNKEVLSSAQNELEFVEKKGINCLFFLDDGYPKRLKHCEDAPMMLYYKGNADLNKQKIVSIVGTRQSTAYGERVTEELIDGLAVHDPLIVSGMAYGIDICAHKRSLHHQLETVGVLAHGLDRIYPSAHKSIADKMMDAGGLITEFMSGTNPDRENFPERNRIIAGMADAIIVVEAGIKGGALITANIANSYNRDVFAVPGRTDAEFSLGCNYLIKTNKAALIESAKDIEYLMGWEMKPAITNTQKQLFTDLTDEEELLVNIIRDKESIAIDDLCLIAELAMSKTSALLLNLEFSGIVKSLPGKIYKLN